MRPENFKSRLALLSILAAFVFGVTGAAVAADPANFADALAQLGKEVVWAKWQEGKNTVIQLLTAFKDMGDEIAILKRDLAEADVWAAAWREQYDMLNARMQGSADSDSDAHAGGNDD